jgi:hypothetical protein
MKKILLFALYFALAFIYTGKSFSQIPAGVYKIQGLWEMNSEKAVSYEQWKINPDSSLQGIDFAIGSNGDTINLEFLEIKKIENDVFYIAAVTGQNEGKPVCFKMVEWTRNVFIFENKEHDFPQRIMYYIKNDSLFNVIIEGPEEGNKIKSIEFVFTKK